MNKYTYHINNIGMQKHDLHVKNYNKLHNVYAYVKIRFRSIQKRVDHICTKQL
jgi:hypothetical protein